MVSSHLSAWFVSAWIIIPLCRYRYRHWTEFVWSLIEKEKFSGDLSIPLQQALGKINLTRLSQKMMQIHCKWRYPSGDQTCNSAQTCRSHIGNRRCTKVLPIEYMIYTHTSTISDEASHIRQQRGNEIKHWPGVKEDPSDWGDSLVQE